MKKYIYKITNQINNKCYIGQTNNLKARLEVHKKESNNSLLKEDIEKYRLKNFKFDTLIICEQNDSDYYERACIKIYNSLYPNGYNLKNGGMGYRIINNIKRKTCSFTLPKNIATFLIKLADQEQVTRSSLLVRILLEEKKRREKNEREKIFI